MNISGLRVIYSPPYEGTNNLIERWLKRMVCQAWAQEHTPLNSHWLGTKNGGADFHDCWFIDSM